MLSLPPQAPVGVVDQRESAMPLTGAQVHSLLRLDVTPDREIARVVAVGELDCASGDALRSELDALLAIGFSRLVLDLRGLSFIDVVGTRAVLDADAAAHRAGARLEVIVDRQVGDLWTLLGVTERLIGRTRGDEALREAGRTSGCIRRLG